MRAHLQGASLGRAHLQGAILAFAHLQGADLWEAQLQGASFVEAHLQDAGLFGARLEGAWLREAHLEGADFRDAVGLTREQLAEAFGDAKTKVADELRPAHWPAAVPKSRTTQSSEHNCHYAKRRPGAGPPGLIVFILSAVRRYFTET